jgi:hypothetical protein
MAFNPNDHLINLKGKHYLEVKWRLVWFRMEHPDWSITTSIVKFDLEAKYAICKATISDADGKVKAEGTKMEDVRGFADFLEKAETGSIGRALGVLGYGTQFAPEFDEVDTNAANPRIVDAPIPIKTPEPAKPPRPAVMDLKALGIEFGNAVIHHEGQVDSSRIKYVFNLLTNGAERNATTLSAALNAIKDLSASDYQAFIDALEEKNNA